MKILLSLIAVISMSLASDLANAETELKDSTQETVERQIEILEIQEDDNYVPLAWWKNPPGSYWVRIRCERNSTCYPPAGFKFRNFSTNTYGNECKGRYKRQVQETKDFIRTTSRCSVRGSIFVIPAQYCRGNHRFCTSR